MSKRQEKDPDPLTTPSQRKAREVVPVLMIRHRATLGFAIKL